MSFRLENSQEGTGKTPGGDFSVSRHFAKHVLTCFSGLITCSFSCATVILVTRTFSLARREVITEPAGVTEHLESHLLFMQLPSKGTLLSVPGGSRSHARF